MDWWKILRDQLKVELDLDVHVVNDKDAPITVTLTVTNAAGPPAVDQPEITS